MTQELKSSVGFRINQCASILSAKLSKLLSEFDIAPEQHATLVIVKHAKNATQNQIAKALGKDKTTISRTLMALEKKGLIEKARLDKRTNQISLTKKGSEILDNSAPVIKKFRDSLHSNLTPDEVNTLLLLLDKIITNFEE